MTCHEVEQLDDAYLDGEIDADRAAAIDAHVASCAACAERHERRRGLSEAVRALPYHRAPPSLVARVARLDPSGARVPAGHGATAATFDWRWLVTAASVLMAVSSGVFVVLRERANASAAVADAVVSAHLRSLVGDHLTDVASSDRHTVKPWFAGRIGFSPVVPDLATEGFPLAGGRLDYVEDREAAALVYRRGAHVINVFVWPGAGRDAPPEPRDDQRGYHLAHWAQSGMVYWTISDVARSDLDEFVRRLRAALSTPGG